MAEVHPLSDAQIEEFWPGSNAAEIRLQFDALMKQMSFVWHRSFPRHHELFARIAAERSADLPERIAALSEALAGLPEHWRQWQWKADEKPVFGEKFVRSVYGDNGHGMGRQVIAAVPADRFYFGTLSDFIAAANPDTVTMLLGEIARLQADNEALRGALKPSSETKAAYIGEFSFSVPDNGYDEEGEPFEQDREVTVPWTTVKEIMAAILAYAGQDGEA